MFIKVPATREGVEAFRELTAAGISVNVTLLFAVERYEEIANAWIDGLERRVAAGRAGRPAGLGRELLRLARRHQGRRAARAARPRRPAGHRRGRQREARLPLVPADLLGPALGGAGGQGRARAAPAVGLDVDQEPVLSRHALRRHADRPGHRQHDARGHDRRDARPRRRGGHDRQEGRRGRGAHGGARRASASTSSRSSCTSSSSEGVESFTNSFDSLITTIDDKARALAPARA